MDAEQHETKQTHDYGQVKNKIRTKTDFFEKTEPLQVDPGVIFCKTNRTEIWKCIPHATILLWHFCFLNSLIIDAARDRGA